MTYTQTHREELRLPHNPEQALKDMMGVIEEVTDIYQQETDALEASDARTYIDLQNTKFEAARKYQSGMAQLIARKNELRGVDPTIKNRLQNMQARFGDLSARNIAALKRMRRTTERLGNVIRESVKEAVNKDHKGYSYNATGQMDGQQDKRVSIGVNETA